MTNIGSPTSSQPRPVPSWMDGNQETKTASRAGRRLRFFGQHQKAKALREPSEEITNNEVPHVSGAPDGETINDRRNLGNLLDGAKLQKKYVESCGMDKCVLEDPEKLEKQDSKVLIEQLDKFKSFSDKTSHHILKLYMKIVRTVVTKKVRDATDAESLAVTKKERHSPQAHAKRMERKVEKAVTKKTNAILASLMHKHQGYKIAESHDDDYLARDRQRPYQCKQDENITQGRITETNIEMRPNDPERLSELKLFGGDQTWDQGILFNNHHRPISEESDMHNAARDLMEKMRDKISTDLQELVSCDDEELKAKYSAYSESIDTPFAKKKRREGKVATIPAIRKEQFPNVSEDKFLFSPENALKYIGLQKEFKWAKTDDKRRIKAEIDALETTVTIEGGDKCWKYSDMQRLRSLAAGEARKVREANAEDVNKKQEEIECLTGENIELKKLLAQHNIEVPGMPEMRDAGTQTEGAPIEADVIPTEKNSNGVSTTTSLWEVSADSSGSEESKDNDIKSLENFGPLESPSAIAARRQDRETSDAYQARSLTHFEINETGDDAARETLQQFDARRQKDENSDAYQKRLLAHFQINETGDDAALKTLQQFPKLKDLEGGGHRQSRIAFSI